MAGHWRFYVCCAEAEYENLVLSNGSGEEGLPHGGRKTGKHRVT